VPQFQKSPTRVVIFRSEGEAAAAIAAAHEKSLNQSAVDVLRQAALA
jgi:predicted HicB family RNase H-like nuclease